MLQPSYAGYTATQIPSLVYPHTEWLPMSYGEFNTNPVAESVASRVRMRCNAQEKRQERDRSGRPGAVSCNLVEQLVDELNRSPNIRTAHPPRLPLPNHVCRVSLDRSPRRMEFTKFLLGFHSSFDGSMVLLQNVVQSLTLL